MKLSANDVRWIVAIAIWMLVLVVWLLLLGDALKPPPPLAIQCTALACR